MDYAKTDELKTRLRKAEKAKGLDGWVHVPQDSQLARSPAESFEMQLVGSYGAFRGSFLAPSRKGSLKDMWEHHEAVYCFQW